MVSAIEYISEQCWLQEREDEKKGEKTPYSELVRSFFRVELASILFMEDFFMEGRESINKETSKSSRMIESQALLQIKGSSAQDQKTFAIEALKMMSDLFTQEAQAQIGKKDWEGHKGPRLYRTFDSLDRLFDLDYKLDKEMIVDKKTDQRLYQGSGVGVQSGYSTILLALSFLNFEAGSTIVDLGSGYGRVGLVCSLLRPDIRFIGYEYVGHRVRVCDDTCQFFDLKQSLSFKTQDLSLESFKIPDADFFSLYDPFTKETYEHVLTQIVEISKRKKVTVVTKGNASSWLKKIAKEESWLDPSLLDSGNLCIFRSR